MPRLVPAEACGVWIRTAALGQCALRLPLLRREVVPFQLVTPAPGETYWQVTLRNEMDAQEYAQTYILEDTPATLRSPWTPEELAVASAKRLNEYRGLVALQRMRDGVCVFSALFASNSLWTYCLWSTDPLHCPPRSPTPPGWKPGQTMPAGLLRVQDDEWPPRAAHHRETDPVKLNKTAQKMFP